MYKHIEKDEKKLTDEEIVRALECCTVDEVTDCENCPLLRESCAIIRKYALDLINRLKAENAEYKRKLDDGELVSTEWHNEQVMQLHEYIEELREENKQPFEEFNND